MDKIVTTENISDWFGRRLNIVKKLNQNERLNKVDRRNIENYFIDFDSEIGYY